MIDEFSDDRTGWARFSDDYEMRFRLARSLNAKPIEIDERGVIQCERCVTFVMLNPSKASAFILDPTVTRCIGFATDLGADVMQVANANALRSTDPKELYKRAAGSRGDDATNNEQILLACKGAYRVIAGWGAHGKLGWRGTTVRRLLADAEIVVHHLGLTKEGYPRHPLYLKGDTQPEVWT